MPVELICDTCEEEYTVPPSREETSNYCSVECYREVQSSTVDLVCDYCEEKYTKAKSRKEVSTYCSKSCHNAGMRVDRNTKSSNNWTTFSRKYRSWVGECENCGNNENLHTHHDNPICDGGDLWRNTFTVLCQSCHMGNYDKWH